MSFKNRDGFAIVYAMLFIMLVGVIASMIYLKQSSNVKIIVKKRETEMLKKIEALGKGFYDSHAFSIDSNPNAVLDDGREVITTYQQLASVTGMPQRDAWNMPFRLYISRRLVDTVANFYYHDFYIVSAGENHRFESIYDSANNILTKGGDDYVVKISGEEIEGKNYLINSRKLYNLVKIVRNFTGTLYRYSNSDRTKNFFVSSSCSGNGGGVFGCYTNPTEFSRTNLPDEIGITADVYKDAYGNDYLFANYSNDLSTFSPPYTAKIGMQLPGGKTVWVVFSYSL